MSKTLSSKGSSFTHSFVLFIENENKLRSKVLESLKISIVYWGESLSGNFKNLNIGNNCQNAHWRFRSAGTFFKTQQLFSRSSDRKKQTCCISKYVYFFKYKHISFQTIWEAHKVAPTKMANFLLQAQPRLTMSRVHRHSLSYQGIPSGQGYEACSSIKMPDLLMQKWHWRLHAQLLLTHVRHALPSCQ